MEDLSETISNLEKFRDQKERDIAIHIMLKRQNAPKTELVDSYNKLIDEREQVREKLVAAIREKDAEKQKELEQEFATVSQNLYPVKGQYDNHMETLNNIQSVLDNKRKELKFIKSELEDLEFVKKHALAKIENDPSLKSKPVLEILRS